MAIVFIPQQMRELTGDVGQLEVSAENVRQVVAELEQQFPGMEARLCTSGRLAPQFQVTVDGQLSQRGLLAKVGPQSEVHFLPALGGG